MKSQVTLLAVIFIMIVTLVANCKKDKDPFQEETSETDEMTDQETSMTTESDGTEDQQTGESTDINCAILSEEECNAPECVQIRGESVSCEYEEPEEWNPETWDFLGCYSSYDGCNQTVTWAHSPQDDQCYVFSDSCIPEGWIEGCNECPDINCSILSEEECNAPECDKIRGTPVSCEGDEPETWDPQTWDFLGCYNLDLGCHDTVTWTHSLQDDQCYVFSDTCIPEGWIEGCNECPDINCSVLSEEECNAPECGKIQGAPVACLGEEPENQDIETWPVLGCYQLDMGCSPMVTWAHDPEDSQCYYFSDTCIPQGWIECDLCSDKNKNASPAMFKAMPTLWVH